MKIKFYLILFSSIVLLFSILTYDYFDFQNQKKSWENALVTTVPQFLHDGNLVRLQALIKLNTLVDTTICRIDRSPILTSNKATPFPCLENSDSYDIKELFKDSRPIGFLGSSKNIKWNTYVSKYFMILALWSMGLFILFSSLKSKRDLYCVKKLILQLNSNQEISLKEYDLFNPSTYILQVIKAFQEHQEIEKHKNNLAIQLEKSKSLVSLAKQVSHDIRSPLSALNVALGAYAELPENERILIRNATQRINDIANDLLLKGQIDLMSTSSQPFNGKYDLTKELIPAVIDVLISEKRMQYREFPGIEIRAEFEDSFDSFALINPNELKRILSNLINNSFESFENKTGKVNVNVKTNGREIEITVNDNGKGISPELLSQLGYAEFSHGKNNKSANGSGSGLGLYHARQTIKQFSGSLEIESIEKIGTSISIKLPKINPPDWFAEKIDLNKKKFVISLDDDPSIHEIWRKRLKDKKAPDIIFKPFQSGDIFKDFILNNLQIIPESQFLIDYELLDQKENGLSIIEELNIFKNSTLVTSRYDEERLQRISSSTGLKILPKSLAGLIPFGLQKPIKKYDVILLDDDELVRITWEIKAKSSGKTILSCKNFSELNVYLDSLDLDSTFYVDMHLSEGEDGAEITKKLFDLGFLNLYLATGYSPEQLAHITWVKGIVDKSPRF